MKEHRDYRECNSVNMSKRDYWCDNCNKNINKGSSLFRLTFHNGEFFNLIACSDECKENLIINGYEEDED